MQLKNMIRQNTKFSHPFLQNIIPGTVILSSNEFFKVYCSARENSLLIHIGYHRQPHQFRFKLSHAYYIDAVDFQFEHMTYPERIQFCKKHRLHRYKKLMIYSVSGNMISCRFAIFLLSLGIKNFHILPSDQKPSAEHRQQIKKQVEVLLESESQINIQKEIILSAEETYRKINNPQYSLIDVRSYQQYCGLTSGYNFIKEKGKIPNSKFGCSVQAYQQNMRSFQKMVKLWQSKKIDYLNTNLIFYCGKGYRASQAFIYSLNYGFSNIAMFSGIVEWIQSGNTLQITTEKQFQEQSDW